MREGKEGVREREGKGNRGGRERKRITFSMVILLRETNGTISFEQ